MNNKNIIIEEYALALYMLNNRFHSPIDLVKYWSFSGPCLESHPEIEKYEKRNN